MSGKIIVNHDALLPEYLPSRLFFREEEYAELADSVKNRVSLLLVGPVGSGKTTLVKLLQKQIGSQKFFYVDCLVHDTEYSVLKEIVPSVRASFLRSSFDLIAELRRLSENSQITVCFDNFVRLRDIEVIDKVMALGITVVLVSGIERNFHILSQNATPKLTMMITMKNYGEHEAYRILKARADIGLAKDCYSENILKAIVNATDGNITLGINVLRMAAIKAQGENRNKVGLEDIHDFLPKHREDLELTEDERVIISILREKQSIEHKQLYSLYCQSTSSPKQERTFGNYMQRLTAKSLVKLDLSSGVRVYEAVRHGE